MAAILRIIRLWIFIYLFGHSVSSYGYDGWIIPLVESRFGGFVTDISVLNKMDDTHICACVYW